MPATIGAPAPEFTLKDQDQKEVKLSDFRGKKRVVLIFYPLDWSPVCTKEHVCIVNDKKQFEELDAQHRSFYAEDDGKIHGDEEKPADANSPVVK